MKLSELIAACGDDKVQFQNLDQCTSDLRMDKRGTLITFGTDQRLNLNGPEKLGLVVWLDRDRVAEIVALKESWPMTPNAEAFKQANAEHRVVSAEVIGLGGKGGRFTLADGRTFTLNADEARWVGPVRWKES